jgi:nucleotide-binding universal stress UspA family protein
MTDTGSETIQRKQAGTARAQTPSDRSRLPLRLLAVVDGSERTNRVVDYMVAMAERREVFEAVVLNVQQKSGEARLRGYQTFKQNEVDGRLIEDFGGPIVASVGQRLDKAGIRHTERVAIGDPIRTILKVVTEERCDAVVIGETGSPWQRWLAAKVGLSIGMSPASRLAALAQVPVIVAK